MEKTLIIVKFRSAKDEEVYWDSVFFSELSEYELQEKTEEIVEKFENSGFDDWTFEDIAKELKKQNLVEEPDFGVDWYEILL